MWASVCLFLGSLPHLFFVFCFRRLSLCVSADFSIRFSPYWAALICSIYHAAKFGQANFRRHSWTKICALLSNAAAAFNLSAGKPLVLSNVSPESLVEHWSVPIGHLPQFCAACGHVLRPCGMCSILSCLHCFSNIRAYCEVRHEKFPKLHK